MTETYQQDDTPVQQVCRDCEWAVSFDECCHDGKSAPREQVTEWFWKWNRNEAGVRATVPCPGFEQKEIRMCLDRGMLG